MSDILNGLDYHIEHADCITGLADLPDNSIDLSVFSPPFPSLYAYTSEAADIGNSEELKHEAKLHLSFFYRQLARVIKPGRVAVVHVANIPRMKRSGEEGLFDFAGLNKRIAERAGLIWQGEWTVRKNPQSQAIRTKSRELQFSGLETDRSKTRGCLPDYLLKFYKPGENKVKINSKGQVTRNEWIEWAENCWSDIIETDTLNVSSAKGESDTKHICPLQLEVSRRLILLFSNPGEIVLSPFAGIGSEGFMALGGKSPKTGKRVNDPRRFFGFELKNEYFKEANSNCDWAIEERKESDRTLFDLAEAV